MGINPWLASLLIGVGGACGANLRYWLSSWIKSQTWGKDFFWGTLIVNITGSILLGVVAGYFRDRTGYWFLLLGTGFCGGYTTFSTFSLEVTEAMKENRPMDALLYMTASVVGGFLGFLMAWMAFAKGDG